MLVSLLTVTVVEDDWRLTDGRRHVEAHVTLSWTDVFVPR